MCPTDGLSRVSWVAAFLVVGCAGASPVVVAKPPPPDTQRVQNQIISPEAQGTAKELFERGERAIMAQRWQEAIDSLETLLAADAKHPSTPAILYDLGVAYEGLGDQIKARSRYRDLVKRFPEDANARSALMREASIDAFLEDWSALGEAGRAILARKDVDDVDRMLGLGARGLARIEAGDIAGASHDVQEGLDLVDANHYGATGRLPVAAAQLRFALGEIRRARSEQIALIPVTPDFLVKIDLRCQGLLDAQNAYADAIRSIDPHWAAMSGYRVGEMYRALHRDLMLIPPTAQAKTEQQKQIFYGIMHVRYRALLEKGLEMMRRTLALADKTGDSSTWVKRAEAAKAEMETSLSDEKAQIAKFPFTEEEIQKALDLMKKKLDKEQTGNHG